MGGMQGCIPPFLSPLTGDETMPGSDLDTFDKMLTAESNAIAALRDVRVVYQSSNQPREEIEQQIVRLVRLSKLSEPPFEEYQQ